MRSRTCGHTRLVSKKKGASRPLFFVYFFTSARRFSSSTTRGLSPSFKKLLAQLRAASSPRAVRMAVYLSAHRLTNSSWLLGTSDGPQRLVDHPQFLHGFGVTSLRHCQLEIKAVDQTLPCRLATK